MKLLCVIAEHGFTKGVKYEVVETYYDSFVFEDTIYVVRNDVDDNVGMHENTKGEYASLFYGDLKLIKAK